MGEEGKADGGHHTAPPQGVVYGVWSKLVKGVGAVELTGNLAPQSKEAMRVAVTWAAANYTSLQAWLRPDSEPTCRTCLWTRDEDLHCCVTSPDDGKEGTSLAAATALSLVAMATGRRLLDDVVVTGDLNLRGQVLSVSGLEGKLAGCQSRGMRTLLVPVEMMDKFDVGVLPEGLRDYASRALKGVHHMADVIEAAVMGA